MTISKIGRRSLLMAVPALAMAGRAFAAPPQDNPASNEPNPQPGAPQMTPAAIAMQAWLDEYGRPTAKTMLNGVGPYEFMVDTGANSTVIAARHVEKLGAPIVGSVVVNGTTGSRELPVALIAELTTGAASGKNIQVAVMPGDAMDEDGILGADMFIGKRLAFDIARKQVFVETPKRSGVYGGATGTHLQTGRSINIRNGVLAELPGRVGKVNARLMLDTGAQNCIMNLPMAAALARAHPGLVRYPNVRVTGVTGQTLIGEYVELPLLDMGDVSVRSAGAVAADAHIFSVWDLTRDPAMIIGVDVLSRLRGFTIDYGSRRFEAEQMAALVAGTAQNA